MCKDPELVWYSTRTPTTGEYFHGSRVTYTCDPCYTGGGVITCENGTWIGQKHVSCTSKTRLNIGQQMHQSFFRSMTGTPRKRTHHCRSHHPIVFPTSLAEIFCSDLFLFNEAPSHYPSGQPIACGGTVTFNCEPWQKMEGSSELTCHAQGHFSSPPPKCRSESDCVSVFSHLTFPDSISTFLPFTLIVLTACIPDITCHLNRSFEHGWIVPGGDVFRYGESITYKCSPGFVLRGEAVLTCGADEQFGKPPVCEPGACCAFLFSMYICLCVFDTHKHNSVFCCLLEGFFQLKPKFLSETEVRCPELDDVHFATRELQGGALRPGSWAEYTCFDCYTGGGRIYCGPDGAWPPLPTCQSENFCLFVRSTFRRSTMWQCSYGRWMELSPAPLPLPPPPPPTPLPCLDPPPADSMTGGRQ